MTAKRFHHAYLIVIACCAMSLTSSITWNTAGVFFPPVLKEIGMMRGALALYMTGIAATTAVFLPFAGKLLKGNNVRLILSVFVLVNALTTCAMSTFTSVYHWYIASVFLGLSQAFFLFVATPTLINRWFAEKQGFFIGLCFSFTGIGAVLFNPLAGYVIANYGWRPAYLTLGLIMALLFFPVALFIRANPEDIGLKPRGFDKVAAANPVGTLDERVTGVSVAEAFKSKSMIFLVFYCFTLALFTDLNVYLPSYAKSLGMGVAIVSTIGSATMLGALTGKIGGGALNDKTVFGAVGLSALSGAVGTALMLFLGPTYPVFLLIGGFFYGVTYSMVTVQTPQLVKKIFGLREFPQTLSIVMMILSISSALGQSLWGFVTDWRSGDYTLSFLLVIACAVICGAAGIIAYILRKKLVWTT
ncbi:MAG: MFS transporter [Smithellaceae bacterium]